MREFEIKPELWKKLVNLSKKDKTSYEAVMGKIDEVVTSGDIGHYKYLGYAMKGSQRVHVGHFVLVFSHDKAKDFVSFEDYDHHDKIYG